MTLRPVLRRALTAVAAVVLGLTSQGVAHAAPPDNDDFADATRIAALPFTAVQSTAEASPEADDPYGCSFEHGTVWFTITPSTDGVLKASTLGSDYDTLLGAFSEQPRGLLQEACNDNARGAKHSELSFKALAGVTYYFLASSSRVGGTLHFSVASARAPANDDFAAAVPINAVPPQNIRVDTAAATSEPDEPDWCVSSPQTVWYSYTAPGTRSVTLDQRTYGSVAVYTGTEPRNLERVACATYEASATFRATAGQTYYIQLAPYNPVNPELELDFTVAPEPVADFDHDATDPSVYSRITFSNESHDPADGQFTEWLWDFGDGTTATTPEVSHRYTADGDYSVRLTVQTADGRSATVAKPLAIRTHDVAISRFAVPSTGIAGRSHPITVTVSNQRYDESARVTLYRSSPTGFEEVGSATQWLPVKAGTTQFPFRYTFSPDDAAVGKVTFKAVVAIQGANDALPFDNEVVSVPTTVKAAATKGVVVG
ncbi:PKD repeat protein [Saccharothrix tamanrassetensis]|uniref:PKD repeat protein n=1 Tax=Saccharothrix tamanrassetensis TaxID=1051531 RepID=A0A841CL87_9PSEU|nr:PKD domain-containing protein [Saccharothrix tamanrassetensis]MBB5958059.1 PKD repeat protein [Saccharothrix tamanrassetensis]